MPSGSPQIYEKQGTPHRHGRVSGYISSLVAKLGQLDIHIKGKQELVRDFQKHTLGPTYAQYRMKSRTMSTHVRLLSTLLTNNNKHKRKFSQPPNLDEPIRIVKTAVSLVFLTLFGSCTSADQLIDNQILELHQLPTSSSGLRPVLSLLNSLISNQDSQCPRKVTMTSLPSLGFDENVGFCPMSFGFIKLSEEFVPNLFLTAQCVGECRNKHCSRRGPHKCTEIYETVSAIKMNENVLEVVTKRIPVGCVCASRKAILKRTQLPLTSS
ncbi:hypothetical protein LSTR_LSTR008008 [Laodelphax striatellus]|uniref:Uncharacterized protein n=1 Tax=Laodelphax striatellus TaxID=195883 RepID=A0A482WJQ6_LAOST|nr:hypothetical protein LSTR_LSTR008008 [Laodelphax striatellus]